MKRSREEVGVEIQGLDVEDATPPLKVSNVEQPTAASPQRALLSATEAAEAQRLLRLQCATDPIATLELLRARQLPTEAALRDLFYHDFQGQQDADIQALWSSIQVSTLEEVSQLVEAQALYGLQYPWHTLTKECQAALTTRDHLLQPSWYAAFRQFHGYQMYPAETFGLRSVDFMDHNLMYICTHPAICGYPAEAHIGGSYLVHRLQTLLLGQVPAWTPGDLDVWVSLHNGTEAEAMMRRLRPFEYIGSSICHVTLPYRSAPCVPYAQIILEAQCMEWCPVLRHDLEAVHLYMDAKSRQVYMTYGAYLSNLTHEIHDVTHRLTHQRKSKYESRGFRFLPTDMDMYDKAPAVPTMIRPELERKYFDSDCPLLGPAGRIVSRRTRGIGAQPYEWLAIRALQDTLQPYARNGLLWVGLHPLLVRVYHGFLYKSFPQPPEKKRTLTFLKGSMEVCDTKVSMENDSTEVSSTEVQHGPEWQIQDPWRWTLVDQSRMRYPCVRRCPVARQTVSNEVWGFPAWWPESVMPDTGLREGYRFDTLVLAFMTGRCDMQVVSVSGLRPADV
jgi:hypothetical protein